MLKITDLSKTFQSYPRRADRLKEWLTFGKKTYHDKVTVLKDINLEIAKGEAFGLVGMNGAGKSTLLKIITGTLAPSTGKIECEGRIAALLELGTGFLPELTGRENILVNARLHGISEEILQEKIEEIKAFSELGDYFDKPLRTYSTGMYVRLGFSLAASLRPEVLIVDEALSVGDAYFQQKCLRKIRDFRSEGTTILFVSHDLACVKLLCDRAALLSKGQILEVGEPARILNHYNALIAGHQPTFLQDEYQERTISGNGKARIISAFLRDEEDKRIEVVEAGKEVQIVVEVEFQDTLDEPTVGILIRDRLGYDVFGTNTAQMKNKTGRFIKGTRAHFNFRLPMNIGPGDYTLSCALHADTSHVGENYQWVDGILIFRVLPDKDYTFLGVSLLKPQLEISIGI